MSVPGRGRPSEAANTRDGTRRGPLAGNGADHRTSRRDGPAGRRASVAVRGGFALLAAAFVVAPAGGLRPGDGRAFAEDAAPRVAPSEALPRFLEAMQVGPAVEYRFVVLHPLLVVPPAEGAAADLAATAPGDLLGVPTSSRDQRDTVRVQNLGPRRIWAMPGDVWRLADGDFVTDADAILPVGGEQDVSVIRVAPSAPAESPREEPRLAGWLPGPALLWTLMASTRDFQLSKACFELAQEAQVRTPRRSPIELARGEAIAKRVAEYKERFAALPRAAAAGRREIAGYAVVLDGGFAGIEVFGDPKRFAETWPRRIEGIAVEAALLELENEALDTPIPAANDPDRYVAAVKDAILSIYGLPLRSERLDGLGHVLRMRKDPDVGRTVTDLAGAPLHLVWLRDPTARRPAPVREEPDPLDPGVIRRKGRPTEFEKRWLERRERAKLPPPPPGPPKEPPATK